MTVKFKLEFVARKPGSKWHIRDFAPVLDRTVSILRKNTILKEKLTGGVIQLVLTDDKEIRLLNAEYRGKNKPTDVISLSYFGEPAFPGKNDLVGEIFISVDTARQQAKEHRKSLIHELRFLFAHGLLHVFGYDHEKPEDLEEMFSLQDKILERHLKKSRSD